MSMIETPMMSETGQAHATLGYVPADLPEERAPAVVRLTFPRPVPHPLGGERGAEAARAILGPDFEGRLAVALVEARARVGGKTKGARAAAEIVVGLTNIVEGRGPDDDRDQAEAARLVVASWLASGGSMNDLLRLVDDQRRNVLFRLSEIRDERRTRTFSGGSLGGVAEPDWQLQGLDGRIESGEVPILEGASKLDSLIEESTRLFPVWQALARLKEELPRARAERRRAFFEGIGRPKLIEAHRESLLARRAFQPPDEDLARLKADLDAATVEYDAMKSPEGIEPGPLERESFEKLTAALDAHNARDRELKAAALKAAEGPIDDALAGDDSTLVDSARRCPRAFPANFLDSLDGVDRESVLSSDVTTLAMLLS